MNVLKFIIFLLFFVVTSFSNVFAQIIEQIHLKNGTVIEGYIIEQKPGDYILIQSKNSIVIVDSDSLKNSFIKNVVIDSLSDKWKEYLKNNDKLLTSKNVKQLEFSTLCFENSRYENVYILEKGAFIKFLNLDDNQHTCKWDEIHSIVKCKKPINLLSGMKDVLILHDNSKIVGNIIEQIPERSLKIFTDKGEVITFNFSQIKQIKTEKLCENMDLWSQIQLLDKINIKGENTELLGFISSRTLGKELIFEYEDGGIRKIPLDEIILYKKILNDKYKELYDKPMEIGDAFLNDKKVSFVNLTPHDEYLLLGKDVTSQMKIGDTVCFEIKLKDITSPIFITKSHLENIKFKKRWKNKSKICSVITYEDMVKSEVPFTREVTPLGNIKLIFVIKDDCDYVLYIKSIEKYIVVSVNH